MRDRGDTGVQKDHGGWKSWGKGGWGGGGIKAVVVERT